MCVRLVLCSGTCDQSGQGNIRATPVLHTASCHDAPPINIVNIALGKFEGFPLKGSVDELSRLLLEFHTKGGRDR